MRPLPRNRRQPSAVAKRVPLLLETLEDRCLPSGSTLDPSFNGVGKQTLAFPGGAVTATAVALQPDGKVVVAGTFTGSGGSPQDFALARFNVNGTLDTSFGSSGRVTLDFGFSGGNEQASAAAIQADGKIVVGGSVAPSSTANHHFAVARLTAAGALDSSFGAGGEQIINFDRSGFPDYDTFLTGLAIQPGDQKLIVVGYMNRSAGVAYPNVSTVVARLMLDGSLDPSFAASGPDALSPGKLELIFGGAVAVPNAVALQPDGKIVLAGALGNFNAQRDFFLIRYTTAGVRDMSFGYGGWQALDVGSALPNQPSFRNGDDVGTAVAVQPDGKILVGGSYSLPSKPPGDTTPDVLSAARFNSDGTLDVAFGTDGVILEAGVNKATGVAVDAVGRVILVGYAIPTSPGIQSGPEFSYARYTPSGKIMASSAIVTFGPRPSTADQANAVALDAAGRAVLVGSTSAAGGAAAFALARLLPPRTMGPGMFDPLTATWYLRNETSAGPPDAGQYAYGAPGWIPVVGGGSGAPSGYAGVTQNQNAATIAAFDPSTATWHILGSVGTLLASFQYGGPNWLPVLGTWDRFSTPSVGVVDPSTMTWYLKDSNSGGAPDIAPFQYGQPGDIPVVGDWDGNGSITIGVFRPSNATWYLRNANSPGAPDIAPFAYGASYMKPVAGDWNGDGVWTVGVYDPGGNGAWLLRNSNTPGAPDIAPFAFGAQVWTPLAGHYGYAPASMPERAASGAGTGAAALSTGDLSAMLTAALGRLQQAGVSPGLLGRLSNVTAMIQPLAPGQLGEALPQQNTIVLSPDGAGHGWFVDPTPYQDEEFAGGAALAGSPAVGHEDLLTTVLHELGHIAGLPDDSGSALMTGTLPVGTRRTDALNAVFANQSS